MPSSTPVHHVRLEPGADPTISNRPTPSSAEGVGNVQARGGPLVTIRPGDVIRIAGGEEYWHGAALDPVMTRTAITEGDTQWGPHLTNDEYAPAA